MLPQNYRNFTSSLKLLAMKKIFFALIATFFSTAIWSQEVVMLFGEQYVMTDQSFDGKYSGFLHHSDSPYVVDEEGRITGEHFTFFESGEVESKGTFQKGDKHGSWQRFDQDGNKLSQAYYTFGVKDGPWKIWDENGTLRMEMHYKNGKRVKTWKVYNAEGMLEESKEYGK